MKYQMGNTTLLDALLFLSLSSFLVRLSFFEDLGKIFKITTINLFIIIIIIILGIQFHTEKTIDEKKNNAQKRVNLSSFFALFHEFC